VGSIVLGVGGIGLIQHLSERAEPYLLTQDAPPSLFHRGKVVLSLSSAMVMLAAGPPGGPLRVESSFDPDVYTLMHQYQEGDADDWTYRVDFHEKTVLHISVIGIWLGKRSPVVTVLIPPDLPFDLEARMKGGYLVVDFAGLAVSNADVELNRGVLQLSVSDSLDVPMERLKVRSQIGSMLMDRIGNASPAALDVQHRVGAARVDLRGSWRSDSDIDLQVAFATGELRLPDNVRIYGVGRRLEPPVERELRLPTLWIGAHSTAGNIRVTE
jgi:hypothetical protein